MKVLILFSLLLPALALCETPLVHIGPDGRLVYTPHANTGETETVNVIPDFSHSGYRGGGVKIPDVPVKIVIEPREGPARNRIQAAINEVSKMPLDANGFRGAVLIKAGVYDISEGGGQGLSISAGGVVVRGEGQGPRGTRLQATLEKRHNSITAGPAKGAEPVFEETAVRRITDDYVGTGAISFSVADAEGYDVGDTIRVYFTPNETWLEEIRANRYMAKDSTLWTTERYTIPFERRIANISGNRITLDTPLVHPLQKRYGGGEIRKLVLKQGQRLENVGVENLSVTCPEDGGDKNRISDAVVFNHVVNGWVSGVTVTHQYDAAVSLNHSRHITVQDCASLKPIGPKRGGYRYTYYIGAGSNHILVQRSFAFDGRHDFVTYAWSPGPNVFLDCYSIQGGTQGPHQRWSSGILFDNITLENGRMAIAEHRGDSGSGHGWSGVSDVGWNITGPVTCDTPKGFMNYAFGVVGEEQRSPYVNNTRDGVHRGHFFSLGKHVQPRSLYLKQLEERLGTQAVLNVTTEAQRGEAPVVVYPGAPEFSAKELYIFDRPIEVEIRSDFPGAEIRYTLDGSDPTPESPLYTHPLQIEKPCVIHAIAMDKTGRASLLSSSRVFHALRPVKPADVSPGLLCRYYEGTWPEGRILPEFKMLVPKAETVETTVGLIESRGRKTFYALLFTGYIRVPQDGAYTLTIVANDGASVLIGGQRILDHEENRTEAVVGLYAGLHEIEIQFFQKRYDEALELFWSGPGFEKVPLPASVLFHGKNR